MKRHKLVGTLVVSIQAPGFPARTGGLLLALMGVLGCIVCTDPALAQSKRKLPCLNGPCYPNAMTFGYHQTRWRPWPVADAVREPGGRLRDVPLPPADLPPPDNEDYLRPQNEWERRRPVVPPGLGLPSEAPLAPPDGATVTPAPEGTPEGEATAQPGETTEPRPPRRYQPGGGEQIFQPPGGFPIEPRTPGNGGDTTDLDRLFQGSSLPPGNSHGEVPPAVDIELATTDNTDNNAQQEDILAWHAVRGLPRAEGLAELELVAPGIGQLAGTPADADEADGGSLSPAGIPHPFKKTSVHAPPADSPRLAAPVAGETTSRRSEMAASVPDRASSPQRFERMPPSYIRASEAWQSAGWSNPLRPGSSASPTAGSRSTPAELKSSVTQTALWRERSETGPAPPAKPVRVSLKNPLR